MQRLKAGTLKVEGKKRRLLLWLMILIFAPVVVSAHVKWFVDFSFADPPRPLGEAVSPLFIALTLLSAIVVGGLVLVDNLFLQKRAWYQRINSWLEARSEYSELFMRFGLGATLLISFQAETLLMPDLAVPDLPWVGWVEFFLTLLLLFPKTTPIAGAGTLILYGVGIARFGGFYMLDYALFVGVGIYLLVSQSGQARIKGLGLPALYLTVGFSLCWVALEKVIYPDWGLYILSQNPQLSLGFDLGFFLTSAAFVEFALGYLLIICLLERPISAVVTLVFFLTTTVFGRLEVSGHTIVHAALLVFILEGPGKVYLPPILLHRRIGLRVAFAAVNFALLLAILIVPYSWQATGAYEAAAAQNALYIGNQVAGIVGFVMP